MNRDPMDRHARIVEVLRRLERIERGEAVKRVYAAPLPSRGPGHVLKVRDRSSILTQPYGL